MCVYTCTCIDVCTRFTSSPFSLHPPPFSFSLLFTLRQSSPFSTVSLRHPRSTNHLSSLSLLLSHPFPLVLPRLACCPVLLVLARFRSLLPLPRSPFSLPLVAIISLALVDRAPPPAFLSAERRTGFRRKETTIRRIVATDHSWRVDRINGVD